MNIARESRRPLKVGLLKSHPDDDILHAHLLQLALWEEWELHQKTLTAGDKSTLDYSSGIDVQSGGRLTEEAWAAQFLGITTAPNGYGTDGGLMGEIDRHVSEVARWIGSVGLDVLVTLGLTDHLDDDHIASGIIGRKAALVTPRPIDVFELQDKGKPGDILVAGYEWGTALAFDIADSNPSQFQVSRRQEEKDWIQVPGDRYVSPSTFADLSRYPIGPEGASYLHYAPENYVSLLASTARPAESRVY